MNCLGIILAGGRSRRMIGSDKCLLALSGKPILAHIVDRLRPQIAPIILNANGAIDRFSAFGLPVVTDRFPGNVGPLAGIVAGMTYAETHGFSHIVTVAGDTPFFPLDLINRLRAKLVESRMSIVLAASDAARPDPSLHPTCAIWPASLRANLTAAIESGQRKITAWAGQIGFATVTFAATPYDPFFNINTPEDLQQAERLITEFQP